MNVTLQAGFLWHKVIRENKSIGLRAEITNFVPPSSDQVELMTVQITNISNHLIQFTPTAAIPIFARSADNLRDHRHVTSLLHRINCIDHGILVHPTLSFDERGHLPNHLTYAVLGVEGDGKPPLDFFPYWKILSEKEAAWIGLRLLSGLYVFCFSGKIIRRL